MKRHSKTALRADAVTSLEPRILLAADAGLPCATTPTTEQTTTRQELVFVDSSVEDLEHLGAAISKEAELILLTDDIDAITQITTSLSRRRDIDAVHIVTHGSDGVIQFDNERLDRDTLRSHAEQFKTWNEALADDADILFYACDLARGDVGRSLLREIAELTGSDVAASIDRTGNSSRGGNWDLEFQVGAIESGLAFHESARRDYGHVLVVYNGSDYILSSANLSWEEAQAEAIAIGGNLVSINDADEESFLQSAFGTSQTFWIGLNDAAIEGEFVWANGDPVTYTNWRDSEPNDLGGQDYAMMNSGIELQWDDNGGSTRLAGLIEIPLESTIEIRARGNEGGEQFRLLIDEVAVETFTTTVEDQTFVYTQSGGLVADQVRIEFFGDEYDPDLGIDRNLIVDFIRIDGVTFETEAPTTFSTGTWLEADGIVPGFRLSETLHTDGYFEFAGNSGTLIEVRASGDQGGEQFNLLIDETVVSTFTVSTEFENYRFTAAAPVTADQVRLEFVNDVYDPDNGVDLNLNVDYLALDTAIYETEEITTFSTGTWRALDGLTPGYKQSETLHANGYLQFLAGQPQFGDLRLESSIFNVSENDASVEITILRDNGSDSTVTVEYNSINLSATADEDYTAVSGTAVFAPGQTSQTISIPILGDSLVEGDEQFSFAIDAVAGGAGLLVPRTATVTIADDDSISASGDGLLAEYFDNIDFTNRFPTRIDSTVDFDWGTNAPLAGMEANTFSVRWTGKIEPLYSETYTFQTVSDDGVRLWIDDQLIIDQWIDQPATTNTGTIALNAGQLYDIRMEYYENGGLAVAQLSWSSDSQTLEVVPQSQLYAAEPTDPPVGGNLVGQDLYTELVRPTSIDFSPDGQNTYISEQRGIVKVARNGSVSTFIDIQDIVNGTRDRGLLDLAVHPDFENNPYVYLLFTYDPPEVFQNQNDPLAGPDKNGNRAGRLIRVTADATTDYTTAVAGSEVVLLGSNSTWDNFNAFVNSTTNFEEPPAGINPDGTNVQDFIATDSESHTVGAVEFGPDGALYVSIGDGTSYNRVDPRTVRVQDIDNLSGKVLRIDPLTGEGLADNPFYNGDADANRSKVYQLGLRNPFRMTIDPISGQVYVGDVGWTRWEEINAAGPGANFGWPFYEGGSGTSLETNGYRDLPEADDFYASTSVDASLFALSHSADGINAIVLGDIYTGSTYPAEYQGDLFFNDLGQGIVRNISFDADGNVADVQTFTTGARVVVQILQGPDGNLYYVDLDDGTVGRWVFA
ncbi:MAG: DUF4347 domain-containing protein [Planctomycetota bacterium]